MCVYIKYTTKKKQVFQALILDNTNFGLPELEGSLKQQIIVIKK
jgi:hypothetical protein